VIIDKDVLLFLSLHLIMINYHLQNLWCIFVGQVLVIKKSYFW